MMNMQEYDLYHLWRRFAESGGTTDDGRLTGISSGQLNTSEGPDFESAEFQLDGKIYRGDVEIHIRYRDWQLHGHQMDPRYDRVLLHLVWEEQNDQALPVYNSHGGLIPTLSIRNFPCHPLPGTAVSCECKPIPSDKRLRALAFERFLQRGRALAERMAYQNRDQIFFSQMMYQIGKPRNAPGFARLAEVLQWRDIHLLHRRYHLSTNGWHYILMRLAGLLPPDLSRPEERILPSISFGSDVWARGGLRPSNRPHCRLFGLASFIARSAAASLHAMWHDILMRRLPVSQAVKELVETLMTPRGRGWGHGLALEIIGNVILPAQHHYAYLTDSGGFAGYIEDIYFTLPRANRYGVLKPFEKNYTGDYRFYKDQAYLQLYTDFCLSRRCSTCSFNKQ
jgi:hypothetical protein